MLLFYGENILGASTQRPPFKSPAARPLPGGLRRARARASDNFLQSMQPPTMPSTAKMSASLTLEDFHPDLKPCPATAVVRGLAFREAPDTSVWYWLLNYGLGGCPEDAMGSLFADAKKQSEWAIKRIIKDRSAVYSPKSYGGVEIGRMYADNSSQGMWDEARAAAYSTVEGAMDNDFTACHPSILSWWANEKLRRATPRLDHYLAKRDEVLDEVVEACGVSREDAKQLFNRLTNLGSVREWMKVKKTEIRPPYGDRYKEEMSSIAEEMSVRYSGLFEHLKRFPGKNEHSDPRARLMSFVLSHFENQALCVSVCEAMEIGATVHSLIFDGFISVGLKKEDYPRIEARIRSELGIPLKITHKEFKPSIVVPIEECSFLDDASVAERFADIVGDKLANTGPTSPTEHGVWCWDMDTGLWRHAQNAVKKLILQLEESIFAGLNPVDGKRMTVNLRQTAVARSVEAWLPEIIPVQKHFIATAGDTVFEKLLFDDGVLNMRTGEFRRSFTPTERFRASTRRKFPVDIPESDIEKVIDFFKDVYVPNGEEAPHWTPEMPSQDMPLYGFVILIKAFALAGNIWPKLGYAMIGERNSGKGVQQAAEKKAFGDYVLIGRSADNLLGNDQSTDEEKQLMWLRDPAVDGVRLMDFNEMKMSRGVRENPTYIDGNNYKKLTGTDPLAVRDNHRRSETVRHEMTFFLSTNDLPTMKPDIGPSLLHIVHPNVYTADPIHKCDKRADPNIKSYVTQEWFADALTMLIVDTYRRFQATGQPLIPPKSVISDTKAASVEENVFDVLSERFDLAPYNRGEDWYKENEFFVPIETFNEILKSFKKDEKKLVSVSKNAINKKLRQIAGYYTDKQVRTDGKNTKCILGIKRRLKDEE